MPYTMPSADPMDKVRTATTLVDTTLPPTNPAGGSAPPPVTMAPWTPTGGAGTPPPPVAAPAPVASDGAQYARAKDRIGGSVQGLTKALRNQFSSRGLSGSSIEGRELGGALSAANSDLSDVTRDIAIEGADDENDFALAKYQGGIAQRGQDLAAISGLNSASLTARGQDIGIAEGNAGRAQRQSENRLSSILGLLAAMRY